MKRIGIVICDKYRDCAGGKCFRALRERNGAFSLYPVNEHVEIAGYTSCGGCPGGNIEYAPEEMKKNGIDTIHLATGLVVGYPPCPRINDFKAFIESRYKIPVIIGTHPIPMKYLKEHVKLPFWDRMNMRKVASGLFEDDESVMKAYD